MRCVWTPVTTFGWLGEDPPNNFQAVRSGRFSIKRHGDHYPWNFQGGPFGTKAQSPLWTDPAWLFRVFETLDLRVCHVERVSQPAGDVLLVTASVSAQQALDLKANGAVDERAIGGGWGSAIHVRGTYDLCLEIDATTLLLHRIEARMAFVDPTIEVLTHRINIHHADGAIPTLLEAPGPDPKTRFVSGFPAYPERDAYRLTYIWRFSHHGEPPPIRLNARARRLLGI